MKKNILLGVLLCAVFIHTSKGHSRITNLNSNLRNLPLVSCFGPDCHPETIKKLRRAWKSEGDQSMLNLLDDLEKKQSNNFLVNPILTENLRTIAFLNEVAIDVANAFFPKEGRSENRHRADVALSSDEISKLRNEGFDIYPLKGKTGFDKKMMTDDVIGLVAIHKDKKLIVITFHGSRIINDWSSNNHWEPINEEEDLEEEVMEVYKNTPNFKKLFRDYFLQRKGRKESNFFMHGGFFKQYLYIKKQLYKILEDSNIINWNDTTKGRWKIILNGHSMGAAIAQVAHLDLVLDFAQKKLKGDTSRYSNLLQNDIMAFLISAPVVFLREAERDFFHEIVGQVNIIRLNVHGDPIPITNPRILGMHATSWMNPRLEGYLKGTVDMLATLLDDKGVVQVGYLAKQEPFVTMCLAKSLHYSQESYISSLFSEITHFHLGTVRKTGDATFDAKLVYGPLEHLLERGLKWEVEGKRVWDQLEINDLMTNLINGDFVDYLPIPFLSKLDPGRYLFNYLSTLGQKLSVSLNYWNVLMTPFLHQIQMAVTLDRNNRPQLIPSSDPVLMPEKKLEHEVTGQKKDELDDADSLSAFIIGEILDSTGGLSQSVTSKLTSLPVESLRSLHHYTHMIRLYAILGASGFQQFVYQKILESGKKLKSIPREMAGFFPIELNLRSKKKKNRKNQEKPWNKQNHKDFMKSLDSYLSLLYGPTFTLLKPEQRMVAVRDLYLPAFYFSRTGTFIRPLLYFKNLLDLDLSSIFDIKLEYVSEEDIKNLEVLWEFPQLRSLTFSEEWLEIKSLRPDLLNRILNIKDKSKTIDKIFFYSGDKKIEIDDI